MLCTLQVDALARERPGSVADLLALKRVPRFSANKREIYAVDIVDALQQARPHMHVLSMLAHPACLHWHIPTQAEPG